MAGLGTPLRFDGPEDSAVAARQLSCQGVNLGHGSEQLLRRATRNCADLLSRVRNQSPDRQPLVVRIDPGQRSRTPRPQPALVTLPPGRPRAASDAAARDRPAQARHRFLPSSLRTQAATLFVLLAIVVSSLLATIALAYQGSDRSHLEADALQDWHFGSARIDATAQSVISNVYLWNNAMLAKDPQEARQLQNQIATDSATITSLVAEISALSLPSSASVFRATHSQAALEVPKFAASFIAAGPHSDADLQVAGAAARKAWAAASTGVDPYITAAIAQNEVVEVARATHVYQVLGLGGVAFLMTLVLLGLLQFRLTLRPIAGLASIANTLAAGRSATITATNRKDEIGQLTGALAAWQGTVGGALFRLRGEVADSDTTLSVAAQELAAATSEQTAAATATSASMEILAQRSESIADTIDRVAIQAGQTRSSLELAQTDLRSSGDRTLALAGRVDEIEHIVKLINDIADQTNLLALNAAIEADRAGDAGRGFAVVADEVRRLAEHSKAAAADIARLVQGAQSQSSETVMALEKGVKQMERGLVMMQGMADLSGQVQVATKQQRSVTAQVVLAIEHIAEGSRSVAITAGEIASSASSQGELAADLAGSDWNRDRKRSPASAQQFMSAASAATILR
jgi:methyl-accepting chemotaxis protein